MNIDTYYDSGGTAIETPATTAPALTPIEEKSAVRKLVAQVGGRRARNILARVRDGGDIRAEFREDAAPSHYR